MHKSWSVSYSYTNDGSKVSEVIHKSHNDGQSTFEDGYSRIQDKDLNEKFYKIKKNKDSKKTLLGKSKNKEQWNLLGEVDGKKHYLKKDYVELSNKYLDNPSKKHRLDKKSENTELVDYNPNKELEKMFKEMNLSMFNDDFFKF